MGNPTADNQPKVFTCVARRHMDAEFRVYDAMLAICKANQKEGAPLPTCYAKTYTLANMIDRSMEQVRGALRKLENDGWIVDLHPLAQRRQRRGIFSTAEYRVLEHDEYVSSHPKSCPALRYDPATGEKLKPGEATTALGRYNIRKMARLAEMPDCWADAVREMLVEKADTGNPVAVADTGIPVPVESQPPQENLCRAATGKPVQPPQENPLAATGDPVASLLFQPDTPQLDTPLQPASLPETRPGGRQAGGGVTDKVSQPRATAKPTPTALFNDFIKAALESLPEAMAYAIPKDDRERLAILQQLEQLHGDYELLADGISEWAENRSPPIAHREYGRWSCWLAEGSDLFLMKKEHKEYLLEREQKRKQ